MISHLLKSSQALLGLAAFALLGVAGCGSETAPSPTVNQPNATVAAPGAEVQALGKVTVTYRNGHLSFGPLVAPSGATPGLTPQGFGPFTESLLTFDTDPGDGVGTGTCTSTQYCATVGLTNNTARIMQSTFVEILDYTDVQPGTDTISWAGAPFTRSSAYASVFKNSGAIEAADYGDFTSGQRKTVEFKFNVGAATAFSFDVNTYATFPRGQNGGSSYTNVTATDACATAGHVLQTGADDAEVPFLLPFAFGLGDQTYDQAVIGSNGYVLFYKTGGTIPTVTPTGPNQTLAQGSLSAGLYVFWDDLAYDAGDGVCTVVTGTEPNRQLTVTWSKARISTNQPGKTFSTEQVTYSAIITENSDNFEFRYNLPTAITTLTRGGSSTIGVYEFSRGQVQILFYGYNGASVPPASASNYPSELFIQQGPGNP